MQEKSKMETKTFVEEMRKMQENYKAHAAVQQQTVKRLALDLEEQKSMIIQIVGRPSTKSEPEMEGIKHEN